MALSFIGFGFANSANPPTPSGAREGDLVCVVAHRTANATAPTVPAGWNQIAVRSTIPALVAAWAIWDGNTIPAFTNATSCQTMAWEGYDVGSPYGNSATGGATSTTITFPAVTLVRTDNTSHLVRAVGDERPDVTIPTPAGHTIIRTSATSDRPAYASFRIGPVTTAASVNVTVSRSSAYSAISFEIKAALTAPSSAPTPTFGTVVFNSVTVNWSAPSGVTERVKVQRAASSGGPWTDIADLAAADLTFNDTSPVSGATNWYRIVTVNGAGSFNGTAASVAVPARTITFSGIVSVESFGTTLVNVPAPPDTTVIDDLNRSETPLDGGIWGSAVGSTGPNGLTANLGLLQNLLGGSNDAVTLADFNADVDFIAGMGSSVAAGGEEVYLFIRMQNASAANWSAYYVHWNGNTSAWEIVRHNSNNTENVLATGSRLVAATSKIAIGAVGDTISAYYNNPADSKWYLIASATDSSGSKISSAGKIGIAFITPGSASHSISSLQGGPLAPTTPHISPSGIASGEAFGSPLVNHGQNILLNSGFEVDVNDWVVSNNPAGNVVSSSRVRSTAWAESGVGSLNFTATRDAGTGNTDMGVATTQRYAIESAHTEIFRFVINLNAAPSGGLVIQLAWVNAAGAGVSNSNFFFTGLSTGRYLLTVSADPPATATRVFPVIRARSNVANETVDFNVDEIFLGFGFRPTLSGIASAQAFGTSSVQAAGLHVQSSGIASAEAFGTAALLPQPVTISGLGGIASAESIGAATVTARLPVYVASTSQSGINGVNGTVNPGLPAGVAVGDTLVAIVAVRTSTAPAASVLTPPSGWLLGSTDVRGSVGRAWWYWRTATGSDPAPSFTIAGGSGNGPFQVAVFCIKGTNPAGPIDAFASNAGATTPALVGGATTTHSGKQTNLRALVFAIAGTDGSITWPAGFFDNTEIFEYTLSGIDSAVGTIGAAQQSTPGPAPTLNVQANLPGNASWVGYTIAFNTAGVTPTAKTLTISGISSAESFGTLNCKKRLTLTATGIASAESFGTTQLKAVKAFAPNGIASAEAFGTARVNRTLPLSGIASAESFGTARLRATIKPTGIASVESFGSLTVTKRYTVNTAGISSAQAFGSLNLRRSNTLSMGTIASAEAVGTPTVRGILVIYTQPVPSAEAFGFEWTHGPILAIRRSVGRTDVSVIEPATAIVERLALPSDMAVREPVSDVSIRETEGDYVELLPYRGAAVVDETNQHIESNEDSVTKVIDLSPAPSEVKELN